VQATWPDARFVLAGPAGPRTADLQARFRHCVTFADWPTDERMALAQGHVIVHAGWVGELPRVLLQALAVGRPLIATNRPGANTTVDERVNGILVAPRDAGALADAMESCLQHPDLLPAMARASRAKAERRFDMRPINRALLHALRL
jgi:glycosyltransferase involved in cell wall biosynthesis